MEIVVKYLKKAGQFLTSVGHVFAFIGRKIFAIVAWYQELWVKLTYNEQDQFVYKRALAMVAGTFAAVALSFSLLSMIVQSAYYLITYKKETVYLFKSEEILPEANIWNVTGCYSESCGSNSSLYYRIEPGTFHHLWSITHKGRIFIPDALGSTVPTGLTKCEVISYGVRIRTIQLYPIILDITCDLSQHSAQES